MSDRPTNDAVVRMCVAVIGSSGDVGTGVVEHLLSRGHEVIAIGRDASKLEAWSNGLWPDRSEKLRCVAGSFADDRSASDVVDRVLDTARVDAVVASINRAVEPTDPLDLDEQAFRDMSVANLLPHIAAARAFIPRLRHGSTYMAVGGGMADLIFPGRLDATLVQAALRGFFQHLAVDRQASHVATRLVMLYAMIRPRKAPLVDQRGWIDYSMAGGFICDVIERIDEFPGPILKYPPKK